MAGQRYGRGVFITVDGIYTSDEQAACAGTMDSNLADELSSEALAMVMKAGRRILLTLFVVLLGCDPATGVTHEVSTKGGVNATCAERALRDLSNVKLMSRSEITCAIFTAKCTRLSFSSLVGLKGGIVVPPMNANQGTMVTYVTAIGTPHSREEIAADEALVRSVCEPPRVFRRLVFVSRSYAATLT